SSAKLADDQVPVDEALASELRSLSDQAHRLSDQVGRVLAIADKPLLQEAPIAETTFAPRSLSKAHEIEQILRGPSTTVILDLNEIPDIEAERLLDFVRGVSFAWQGDLTDLGRKTYLLHVRPLKLLPQQPIANLRKLRALASDLSTLLAQLAEPGQRVN